MSTYSQLVSDVSDWLNRDDLAGVIPSFVRLCEAEIRRKVRVRAMETTADITVDAQTVALPTGFIEARRFSLNETNGALEYLPPERLWESNLASESAGQPTAFTIEGDNFVFAPTPSGTYTGKLLYYKAFTAFSADADTNWLLDNAYDVYLYGSLLHSAPYIGDDERIQLWERMYQTAVGTLNTSDSWGRVGGSSRKRTGLSTP